MREVEGSFDCSVEQIWILGVEIGFQVHSKEEWLPIDKLEFDVGHRLIQFIARVPHVSILVAVPVSEPTTDQKAPPPSVLVPIHESQKP